MTTCHSAYQPQKNNHLPGGLAYYLFFYEYCIAVVSTTTVKQIFTPKQTQ